MDRYRTVGGRSRAELEEKRSRFIGEAAPAATEQEALAFLEEVRGQNRTARHVAYAYVLRDGRARFSDDGEPAKTAGTPILDCIRHRGLSDVVVTVTRYFGGILLGTGGLVRCYGGAASAALEEAGEVTVQSVVRLQFAVPYPLAARAERLAADSGARLASPVYAEDVRFSCTLPRGEEESLLLALQELGRGTLAVEVSEPFFAPS